MESIEKASMFNLDAAWKPGMGMGMGEGAGSAQTQNKGGGERKVLRMGKQVF